MCKFTKILYPLMQMLIAFSFYCCMVHMVRIFFIKKVQVYTRIEKYLSRQAELEEKFVLC